MQHRLSLVGRSVRRLGMGLLVVFALRPTVASAQQTAPERETARSLMDEADRYRAAGDHWHALERYTAADQIMHVPTTGIEVAREQAQVLQLIEARATAIAIAVSAAAPNEPAVFARARAAAATLANELAPRIASVTVIVEPLNAPYSVTIDGVRLPPSARSLPFKLNPGSHNVVVEAVGFATLTNSISLAEAQASDLRLRLVPSDQALSTTTPGIAPSPSETARAGGDSFAASSTRDDPNSAGRTRGYVALGVGGAVLAAGTVFGVLAIVKSSDVKKQCDSAVCPRSAESDLSSANTLANVANVMLPIGALGVAYGLFELLTHSGSASEHASQSHLRVGVALGNPGVSLRGEL